MGIKLPYANIKAMAILAPLLTIMIFIPNTSG